MNIKNTFGLAVDFLENGSLQHVEAGAVRISLKPATAFSQSGANLYLRKKSGTITFKALTGPYSNSTFQLKEDFYIAQGQWEDIQYQCVLQLSKESLSWQWSVETKNLSDAVVELDIVYQQDVGLKPVTDGLVNEYYVSQYLERRILDDRKYGSVLCCRQNMKEATGNAWIMIACANSAVSGCVDGMQFYGKTFRETGIPEGLLKADLGGEYSGESSVVALQEKPFTLAWHQSHHSVFVATCLPDHPEATSVDDLKMIPGLLTQFVADISLPKSDKLISPDKNFFNVFPFLPVDELNDEDLNRFFGTDRRHVETENGKILSFFNRKYNHVMLRDKEILADRPHGHIMQAKSGYQADENIVSTTAFAFGVFNSHLTQGNTNFNIFLSVCSSQFNQSPETGQRIFVAIGNGNYLLGVPSAFEMGLNHCRWIYKSGDSIFQVRTWTSKTSARVNLDFKVLAGEKVKLLLTHHFDASNGWTVAAGNTDGEYVAKPKADSMIVGKFPEAQFRIVINGKARYKASGAEALYFDHKSHGASFFVLDIKKISKFGLSFIGEVCEPVTSEHIKNADKQWASDCNDAQSDMQHLLLGLEMKGDQDDIAAIREILPWFGSNAMTHFLTPHGLEQFGGAAWGTRDVSQGPFDLLLCLEKFSDARKLLLTLFSNQNPVGDWPQWWMFDSYFNIRAGDCHGDVYYWCLISLSNYVKVTGDTQILEEILPYYHEKGSVFAEKAPLSQHIEILIQMIVDSFIPGTALVPFGGGDWNDSLQPVSKELAQRMISSWTVEMNFQAFSQYQHVYEMTGETDKASRLKAFCEQVKTDFNKHLIRDKVVAGYGLVEDDGSISVLLHPTDTKTGIKYSILPMDRGIISEIFTKEQAEYHQDLIEQYLKGPDGARLMDRPLKYKGGIQTIFQRAESSTFFGREIGLMYIHEHIRYAESQALTGKADAFVKALRQANPVGYRGIVTCGDIRQSNCYYSSSDVSFKNRYEADECYDEIKTGNLELKGGWRVYSSGPGIYITLIISRLLGLRSESGKVIIDPVIPKSMDGISARMIFLGKVVTFSYSVREDCFNPKRITVNGKALKFGTEDNKYRKGGASIPKNEFVAMLNKAENQVKISL